MDCVPTIIQVCVQTHTSQIRRRIVDRFYVKEWASSLHPFARAGVLDAQGSPGEWLHFDRTIGRHCHNRNPGGTTITSFVKGEICGVSGELRQQFAPDWRGTETV